MILIFLNLTEVMLSTVMLSKGKISEIDLPINGAIKSLKDFVLTRLLDIELKIKNLEILKQKKSTGGVTHGSTTIVLILQG